MSFNIRLVYNKSADNVAEKTLTTIDTLTGTLREETSITNPVIKFEYSGDLENCNYFYIPKFQRYYFVTDIRSIRDDMWEVSGHCDVLTTAWKLGQLKQCQGITKKQAKLNNLYINDGSFKVYQNPLVTCHKFTTGFTTQSFILAVAGSRT